jgi:hypothetical protein
MIKYILKCKNNHEFESWFSNSKEFDKLKKKELLECIFCKSKKIDKSIMAPQIMFAKSNKEKDKQQNKEIQKMKKDLFNIRKFIEKNFTYVGDRFAKEAKNIFYDNKNNKNIYGTTTEKERKDLEEEGIELANIPWLDKDN